MVENICKDCTNLVKTRQADLEGIGFNSEKARDVF